MKDWWERFRRPLRALALAIGGLAFMAAAAPEFVVELLGTWGWVAVAAAALLGPPAAVYLLSSRWYRWRHPLPPLVLEPEHLENLLKRRRAARRRFVATTVGSTLALVAAGLTSFNSLMRYEHVAKSRLPRFPWPPPNPTFRVVIPMRPFFQRLANGEMEFTVPDHYATALNRAELLELFQAPLIMHADLLIRSVTDNHISYMWGEDDETLLMVSCLQPIDYRGRVLIRSPDYIVAPVDDFAGYVNALLKGRTGLFRVSVFVLSITEFGSDSRTIEKEEATRWHAQGLNSLPIKFALKPLGRSVCTLLLYEFERNDIAHDAKLMSMPGRVGLANHLEALRLS